ncbi:hypothetical protein NIES4071_05470 [Calothrix sp. NIES-4071]|nr:hypothetical protein NIES4071_05470 [Calothrix sp. NIES-4071]BAZ54892.1 hypothetical protein NIES4105_05460 [Calothrix sp. NIES-4105]
MKKILILAANPKDTSNLRLGEEVREINNTLRLSPNRNLFQIITESAVRVDDLTRSLFEHQPTIVHFCGHGSGADGLVFESDYGHTQLVSTQALARLFDLVQQQVECVLLNACYSEEQAEAIHQHIDCVVGMDKAIGDKAAIKFSVGFYTALAAPSNYDVCYKMGCASIDLQGIPEYSTPKIKFRPRNQQVQSIKPVKSAKKDSVKNNISEQNRSISIGGNVTGSAIQTGNKSTAKINFQQGSLPAPESVNIQAEISAVYNIIAQLETPDRRKINNAFEDVEEELSKTQPDKEEAGMSLKRALDYAKKAEGFAEVVALLQPHLNKISAWLEGKNFGF